MNSNSAVAIAGTYFEGNSCKSATALGNDIYNDEGTLTCASICPNTGGSGVPMTSGECYGNGAADCTCYSC